MYRWLVYLHIVGVLAFVMAHGVSAMAVFSIKRERNLDRIRGLLQFSKGSLPVAYVGLLLILATGILNGFLGHWWKYAWIWVSIGLFVLIAALMSIFGSNPLNKVRVAVGLPGTHNEKPLPEAEQAEGLAAAQNSLQPAVVAWIGIVGLLIITGLMWFKPF